MGNPEPLEQRPSLGEKIHSFLANYDKSPIVDGVIIGAITVGFGLMGGPIVSARALGGGLFGSIAMRYMGDRAKEIQILRNGSSPVDIV